MAAADGTRAIATELQLLEKVFWRTKLCYVMLEKQKDRP